MSWLDDLKIGDIVVQTTTSTYSKEYLGKVVKITKTQVHVVPLKTEIKNPTSVKFRKSDGSATGKTGKWEAILYITEFTKERQLKFRRTKMENFVKSEMNCIEKLSLETLEKIINILKKK